MNPIIRGHVIKYGDNVDTDVIIPARHCNRFDPEHLAQHCMEDLDKDFLKKIKPGDVMVAGTNFGCGSSRELAPLAIKAASISCIIARSFSRIFYRNAINIGLPILECCEAADHLQEGEEAEVEIGTGRIRNLTRPGAFRAAPFPELVQEIIEMGGIVEFVRSRLKVRG